MVLIPKSCPECASTHFIVDFVEHDVVCKNCGLVIEQNTNLKEKVIFT